jgi:hypothetical protein
MSAIAIVDTSILINLLNVPNMNQDRETVLIQFEEEIKAGTSLLLPFAAIVESGNHIAHIADGRVRRERAGIFVDQIRQALNGSAPWTPLPFPDKTVVLTWLDGFPDMAMKEIGMGDQSIIEMWKEQCARFPTRRVFIWSVDQHLSGYDRRP